MALGPKELKKKIAAESEIAVAILEQMIDGDLTQKYTGQSSITISLLAFEVKPLVRKELIKKYEQAGWSEVDFIESPSGNGTSVRLVNKKSKK